MHLAQFIHRYPPALGGAEAYAARLSEYMAGRGDAVRVWTSSAIELEDMWRSPRPQSPSFTSPSRSAHGLSISRFRPLTFPLRRYVLKSLSLAPFPSWQCLTTPCNPVCPRMWREAGRDDGPLDAVHAVAFPYSFPIACALRLARRRGVPFYLTPFLHVGDAEDPLDPTRRQYTRPHLRWLLRQADGVFVQTPLERTAVVALGAPAERVLLQGLGVDASECGGGNRARLRARLGIASDEVVVGHLANQSEEKGTCDLLRAAEMLWRRGMRFRIVLAGPEMPNFRAFWKHYPFQNRIARLGVVTAPEKRDFYAGIDGFALPSRTDSFGLVLLEAWANRRANLVYRAGGPGELVRDEVDGLHAPCGDVGELSRQLQRLVSSEPLRQRLGEAGFSRTGREFQWRDKLEMVRTALAREGVERGVALQPLAHVDCIQER